MDKTERELRYQIEKWTKLLEKKLEKITSSKDPEFLKNIKAYYSDSKHFFEEKDFIRSFEALLWSYSWLEIGIRYSFLEEK